MRSFNVLFLILASVISFSVAAQATNDMDWLQKSMDKGKETANQLKAQGILEQFAPGAVEKQIEAFENVANKVSKESSIALATTLEQQFGVSAEDSANFSGGGKTNGERGIPSVSAIFVSFSMTNAQLVQAFEEAERVSAELFFRGMHPQDNSITDTMLRIKALMKGSSARPSARFNPKAFKEFHVTHTPVMLHASKDNVAFVSGMLNFDWLKDQMRFTSGLTNLGKRGPTKPVLERDLIEEMQERLRGIDMEGKKKQSVEQFWKKQQFVTIPNAKEDKEFYIDPTVRVQSDIVNPNGEVLARAGDVINPLLRAPSKNTYLLFNAKEPEHLVWLKAKVAEVGFNGIVMLMTSELDRDNGWEHLSKLRKEFNQEIYMIPKQLVERFSITGLPAKVTTEDDVKLLKIQQYAIGE